MSEEAQSPPEVAEHDVPETVVDLRLPAALVRTALSSEQTLMSWVRTALSLFTFGFSITQFFYYLEQQQEDSHFSAGPRRLGISLIGLGIFVLMLAAAEHVHRLRQMKEQGLPPDSGSFLPIGSAGAILAIGIVALVSVFLNWHL